MRVDSQNLTAVVGSVRYDWYGGFGAVIQSHERGIRVGDVRRIGDTLFHCYMVSRLGRWFWQAPTVSWTVDAINAEWLRDFKAAFFGVDRFVTRSGGNQASTEVSTATSASEAK